MSYRKRDKTHILEIFSLSHHGFWFFLLEIKQTKATKTRPSSPSLSPLLSYIFVRVFVIYSTSQQHTWLGFWQNRSVSSEKPLFSFCCFSKASLLWWLDNKREQFRAESQRERGICKWCPVMGFRLSLLPLMGLLKNISWMQTLAARNPIPITLWPRRREIYQEHQASNIQACSFTFFYYKYFIIFFFKFQITITDIFFNGF